jgi:hypothetical protein
MMKRLIKPIALWLLTLTVLAIIMLSFEADLLWKVQQHNVFLNTSLFFHQMMAMPGGMLSYLGAFFTQHFYYPWVGVILLCGWWLLLMWLTKRTFNIPDRWTVVTVIPVAILLVANMDMGYWVYFMKMPGYFYAATIGTTAATALLWAFRSLPENKWIRSAFIFVAALAGYPLMGAYGLAAVSLMAVLAWRMSTDKVANVIQSVVALLSIIAIPLLYYRYVYVGTNSNDIYRVGIPVFGIVDSYPNYYIPYYILGLFFLLVSVVYSTDRSERTIKTKDWILQGCVFAAVAGCVYHFWYKDANFHHELRMQRCIEQADWEGVVEEGEKQDGEPTRAIVMMHNLALSRLGRQCDEMYNFPKGSKRPNSPLPVYMFNVAGRMMLYQYGAMNECHRICMEEGVEYGWNVEQLRDLARSAMFNKEKQTARKFLDILRQTTYYGGWADHMESLLNDPQALAKDAETGPVSRMMHYTDRLDAVEGKVENALMTTLAEHDADDICFQEQAVLAAMWTRNPDLFWPRFDHYVQLNGEENMPPRIFQEAAWLFANLQGQEGLDEWSLEPGVQENFSGFMRLLQQYKQAPTPSNRKYIYDYYGKTYYFEFFFLRDITYY